jgi:exo-1,4-beta-D-glucosaminidase
MLAVLMNGGLAAMPGEAIAKVFNLDTSERFSKEATLDVAAGSSNRVFRIPELQELTSTYFIKLTLEDAAGKLVGSNFFWLSTQPEVLDWERSMWFHTPTKSLADFTALQSLPKVEVKASCTSEVKGDG